MATIEQLKITQANLLEIASRFAVYSEDQSSFNTARTNLGKELAAITDAVADVSHAMVESEKKKDEKKSDKKSPTTTIADGFKVATASMEAMQDALTGRVSVDDMSKVAESADKGYDMLFSSLENINPKACKSFVKAYKENNPFLFSAGGQIKKNASQLLANTDKVMTGISGWGGSYGEPDEAANKIYANVSNIASGTVAVATSLKKMTDKVYGDLELEPNWLNHYLEDGENIASNLGEAASGLTQAGSLGIGSFYTASAGLDALRHGNIATASGYISSAIGGVVSASAAVVGGVASAQNFKETWKLDHKQEELDAQNYLRVPEEKQRKEEELKIKEEEELQKRENDKLQDKERKDSSASMSVQGGDGRVNPDDYSADMIHEINIVLDGAAVPKNSFCVIKGHKYKVSGYSLSQELLQPMLLTFSLEKDDKIETRWDVVFSDFTHIIGTSFDINVSTIKTSLDDTKCSPVKAFVLKGMVLDVGASRASASMQSAVVTVATWDALLQGAPHCRSFENLTLKEVVNQVLKPYGEIRSQVNPRFTQKIPYLVQYNQSDYSFLSMLAMRFGEWMYNTGEIFIFGEMEDLHSKIAKLEYPGGSLMSYNLQQSMQPFNFNYMLPNYYQFGGKSAICNESASEVAEEKMNDWTDLAYDASQRRYKNNRITPLTAGGFDFGKDDEGADDILDYSLKIEAKGKKAFMVTVDGYSKLATLKIGQTFSIRDKIQNRSGENKDISQFALKVIGIRHMFDYQQEYSNSFTAVPVNTEFPGYSTADVHAVSPSQRATVVDNVDQQQLGRIRVQFPWQEIQDKNMKSPWLRIAVPYAGGSKGHQFVPEIGEEVMVGFEMNNAERPYIIGALYNGGNGCPDTTWAASNKSKGSENNVKAIRTRNGHTILFNDQGDAGVLEIYDNKNNTYRITLSADEKKITIHSVGKIEISADSDIDISAGGNISMDAKSEVSIQASRVKVR